MEIVLLVLWLLAVTRVTRVITTDYITDRPRAWLQSKLGSESQIVYLFHCSICMSMWVGFASAPYLIWLNGWSWWLTPLLGLAGSAATVVMVRVVDDV